MVVVGKGGPVVGLCAALPLNFPVVTSVQILPLLCALEGTVESPSSGLCRSCRPGALREQRSAYS